MCVYIYLYIYIGAGVERLDHFQVDAESAVEGGPLTGWGRAEEEAGGHEGTHAARNFDYAWAGAVL